MKRKFHAYAAARAVALLAKDPDTEALANLLAPNLPLVAVGAWLPDEKFFKAGSGDTQNHVLKMTEYSGPNAERFVQSHKATLRRLGDYRKLYEVLKHKERLPDDFWTKAYRGDCPRGEHPADCAMGLATTLVDLLLLGDHEIQQDLPDIVDTRIDLPERALTSRTQAALYFFMMSHYLVDAHMPCHADARPLALYKSKLHEKWEEYFDDLVAEFPEPEDIGDYDPDELLDGAVAACALDLPERIPQLMGDVWDEVIWICRASFAVSCIVAPPDTYPLVKSNQDGRVEDSLADQPMPSFRDLFQGRDVLKEELSRAIVHDSVLAVAMSWKKVWQTVHKLAR